MFAYITTKPTKRRHAETSSTCAHRYVWVTHLSAYCAESPAASIHWLFYYETLPQRGQIPHLPRCVWVMCSSLPDPVGMCFILQIFRTNPHQTTSFCFSPCWYLFNSLSHHLAHILSVIYFSPSLGTRCGGRGWIRFENLEALLCCIRLLTCVYCV